MKYNIFLLLAFAPFFSNALQESKSLQKDSRVRHVKFHPNEVYGIYLKPGVATNIVLAESENLVKWFSGAEPTISVANVGNNILIKSVTDTNIDTNLTVISSKRTYYFQVKSTQKTTLFALKFSYPEEKKKQKEEKAKQKKLAEITNPNTAEIVHNNYIGIGDKSLKPEYIFSSNTHTFMKLPRGARIPAVFRSTSANEQLVNSKFENDWLIIYSAASSFTLRLGEKVLCIRRLKNGSTLPKLSTQRSKDEQRQSR